MAPGANNGLYNGNISAMQTTLVKVNVGSANASLYTAQPQLAGYKYDQLNRINEMRTYADLAGGSVISNNNYASLSGSADAYRNTFSYDANGNIESQKRYSDNGTLLDDLTYRYELDGTGKKRSNKLYHVNDSGTSASGDINDQGTFSSASINNLNNYSYDEIGNLVKDKAEEIDKITWTVYGKIKSIERLNTSNKPDLEFVYDAQGNRIQKIVKPKSAPGVLVATNNFINTYYTKDAQGNTLATYEKTGGSLKLKDHSIYGSARLGVLNTDKPYSALSPVYNATNTTGTTYQTKTEGGSVNYEFSNHLGNVLTVVSDRKLPVDNNSDGTIDGFVSDVLSTSDYYAFGSPMPGRSYNPGDYRYGFNGKENDNETVSTGEGTQDYGMRIYNPALGRFLSVDPIIKKYPELTPYQFASNRPIDGIDQDGLEYSAVFGTAWSYSGYDVNTSNQTGVAKQFMSDFKETMKDPETYKGAIRGMGPYVVGAMALIMTDGMGAGFIAEADATAVASFEDAAIERQIARSSISETAAFSNAGRTTLQSSTASEVATFGNRTLIIDENLSPTIAADLKNQGFNTKIFPKGTPDIDIIKYTQENNGIVVTNNIKDFKNQGITTFEVSQSLTPKSQLPHLVNKIKNVAEKAATDASIVKPGENVKLIAQ